MDFIPFPKIARLAREMVITEKLDGANSSVTIIDEALHCDQEPVAIVDGFRILAGSRKRWILPTATRTSRAQTPDNFGFAGWVLENAQELVKLGPGTHYGEWWGKGIQRNYGLDEKRFSLFNTGRWKTICSDAEGLEALPGCCGVVPILYEGEFSTIEAQAALAGLQIHGSYAAPGFMKPEGIMIFHTAANICFKKTIEGDEAGKGQ